MRNRYFSGGSQKAIIRGAGVGWRDASYRLWRIVRGGTLGTSILIWENLRISRERENGRYLGNR